MNTTASRHYKFSRALRIEAAFTDSMGGNVWQPVRTERQKRLHALKIKADRSWLDHLRARVAAAKIQQITAKLEANNWQLACLTAEERALAVLPIHAHRIGKRRQFKAALSLTLKIKQAIRAGYAWPGGYPLSVICNDGEALCMDCARKEWRQIAHDTIKGWKTGWDAAGVEVLWEGGNTCSHCNKNLDAYPDKNAA